MGLRTWFKRRFLGTEEVVVRARDDEGKFIADDPITKENEAYTTKDVKVEPSPKARRPNRTK